MVIFAETGLVVTPFLPGDSLLFVAGSLAASGHLDFVVLAITIFAAAFLGDNSNFFIGKFLGEQLFKNPKSKIFVPLRNKWNPSISIHLPVYNTVDCSTDPGWQLS